LFVRTTIAGRPCQVCEVGRAGEVIRPAGDDRCERLDQQSGRDRVGDQDQADDRHVLSRDRRLHGVQTVGEAHACFDVEAGHILARFGSANRHPLRGKTRDRRRR
jgi:hypothetical protein